MKFYRSFTASAPDELAAYAALMHTPDGLPVAAIAACYSGDLAEGERLLAPLRSFGTPLVDAIQPMPFPVMQTLLDAAVPDGNQNYWKSTFLRELSDEAIQVIVGHANRGDVADDGSAGRAVRRRREPRREGRHGIRAAPRRVRSGHSHAVGKPGRIRRGTSSGPATSQMRWRRSAAATIF